MTWLDLPADTGSGAATRTPSPHGVARRAMARGPCAWWEPRAQLTDWLGGADGRRCPGAVSGRVEPAPPG
jgi:hypothetical protein